ncbi:MAG TPA: alpha/beta hydrolase [Phycisphaerales bacterium]|nr:alpha/beta hydrolase [Phycisphaerales bacterium]
MRSMLSASLLAVWLAPQAHAMQAAAEAAPLPAFAEEAAALEWPSRAASVVREVEVGPWQLRWVGTFPIGWLEAEREDAAALLGPIGAEASALRFEGEGSVLVRMPMGEPSASARIAGKPAAAYEYLSASAARDTDGEEVLQVQRTWFALYEPKSKPKEASGGSKGMVVLLPGMFGTPEPVIDSMVGMLRLRGWHVLRMLTHPSRFTEKASYAIVPGGEIEAVASGIAAEFDDRAGECALAVNAVCARIAADRPSAPVDHRVGLGLSGGGMILSTVVASDVEAYRAAVFVGAGCDFAQVAVQSNYTDWIDSVHIGWVGEPSEADRRLFTETYRAEASLDSYSTAPLLAGLPMLMIHGEADQAVPAAMGDLLWERLGMPERWSAPLGHETLFLVYLPSRTPALLDWLDARADG